MINNLFIIKFSLVDYPYPFEFGFQSPASPIMQGIISLHHHVMFFLVIIIIFTFFMLYFIIYDFTIIKINKENDFFIVKYLYNVKITHNTFLETIWIIIPSLILLSIVLPSFALLYAMDLSTSTLLSMKVIGHQWYWSYEFTLFSDSPYKYKIFSNNRVDDHLYNIISKYLITFNFDSYMTQTEDLSKNGLRLLETTNPVVVPYKTYIKVYVTASDVIHSWAVPSLGIKIDAVPGRLNQVLLYIDRIGKFYGQCSELCGVNHGFMPIEIYSVTKIDYIVYLYHSSKQLQSIVTENFFYDASYSWKKDGSGTINRFLIYLATENFAYFADFCNEHSKKNYNFDYKKTMPLLNGDFTKCPFNMNAFNIEFTNLFIKKISIKHFNYLVKNY